MIKKIISLVAVFAIFAVSLSISFGSNLAYGNEKKVFSDVENHWAKNYIKYVVDNKLFTGTSDNEFSPNAPITRGMLVTILGKFDKITITDVKSSYLDVKDDSEFAPYINWAVEKGLIKPVSENYFKPDDPLSREDVALLIGKYIKDMNFNYDRFIVEYTDFLTIDSEALVSVNQLRKLGIMTGKNNNSFDPKGLLTRAETAAIIYRLRNVLDNTYDSEY